MILNEAGAKAAGTVNTLKQQSSDSAGAKAAGTMNTLKSDYNDDQKVL